MFKKLVINSGSNVTLDVLRMMIIFIMTPIYVNNLGSYDYGLWEMIAVVTGYMGMLDLGIKPAIVRYTAKYHAEDDVESLVKLVMSTLVFLAVVGLIACLILLVFGTYYVDLLSSAAIVEEKYILVSYLLGVQFLIMFPGYMAESVLEGYQLYVQKNLVTMINTAIGSSLLYFLIEPTNALVLLVFVNVAGISIKYLVYFILIRNILPKEMKYELKNISISRLKNILGFGVKSFVQGVAYQIQNGADKVIIGVTLGPAAVPYYSLPSNLVNIVRTLGFSITNVFMPLFSEMDALKDHDKARTVYVTASKLLVALLMPMCVGLAILGGPFISIWIGKQYGDGADAIVIFLVLSIALPMLDPFRTKYLTAIGQHGILAKLGTVAALLNVGFSILAVSYWGVVGVALVTAFTASMFAPIYLVKVCGHLGISVVDYVKLSIIPSLLPSVVMGLLVYFFRVNLDVQTWWGISSAVLVGATVYFILAWSFTLRTSEKQLILARLPQLS